MLPEIAAQADDELGVLSSTLPVVDLAHSVRIDQPAIDRTADRLAREATKPAEWDSEHHFVDRSSARGQERTAQYVLVLDALNFCFWGEPRWQVEHRGAWINGYFALAVALRRAVDERVPILDARYLAELTLDQLSGVLRGRGEVPMLAARLASLREVGRRLLTDYNGQFVNVVATADNDAVALVHLLARDFSSFNDVTHYAGREVRLYKRAQICAADLNGALAGAGPGRLTSLANLTAFADYKVPQVLRRLGILAYAAPLASRLAARELIPAGDPDEVEIRAATVWAVELLRLALAARGRELTAIQIDWLLWSLGQEPAPEDQPYHLTRTIYY